MSSKPSENLKKYHQSGPIYISVSHRLESTNWVHRIPRDPKRSQGSPRGSKEAWKKLFRHILALFGVPGPGRYTICTDRPFFIWFLIRKPMGKCQIAEITSRIKFTERNDPALAALKRVLMSWGLFSGGVTRMMAL